MRYRNVLIDEQKLTATKLCTLNWLVFGELDPALRPLPLYPISYTLYYITAADESQYVTKNAVDNKFSPIGYSHLLQLSLPLTTTSCD